MKTALSNLTGIGPDFVIKMHKSGRIEQSYYDEWCRCGPPFSLDGEEEGAHAPQSPVGIGSRSRNGANGDAHPQRLLADEPE